MDISWYSKNGKIIQYYNTYSEDIKVIIIDYHIKKLIETSGI